MFRTSLLKRTLFALLTVGLLSSCGSGGTEGKTLKVGTDPNYVPFSYTDSKTNKMTGFDHDFAVALAKKMDVQLDYQGVAWDGIIPALKSGKIDAITSISITSERTEQVAFSDAHMKQTIVAVVPAGDDAQITGFEDLRGLRLGVMGSTAAATAVDAAKGLSAKTYNSPEELYRELMLGRLDVVAIESPQAGHAIETEYKNKLEIASPDLGGPAVTIGVAVDKGDKELVAQINEGIAALQDDGTYDKLIQEWFGDIEYQVRDQ